MLTIMVCCWHDDDVLIMMIWDDVLRLRWWDDVFLWIPVCGRKEAMQGDHSCNFWLHACTCVERYGFDDDCRWLLLLMMLVMLMMMMMTMMMVTMTLSSTTLQSAGLHRRHVIRPFIRIAPIWRHRDHVEINLTEMADVIAGQQRSQESNPLQLFQLPKPPTFTVELLLPPHSTPDTLGRIDNRPLWPHLLQRPHPSCFYCSNPSNTLLNHTVPLHTLAAILCPC